MADAPRDLVVVGAGPGGYVAAIRAAQLGLSVTLVEKAPTLGGTCLNVGCIPTKALLESSELYAHARGGRLAAHGVVASEVRCDLGAMMRRKEAVVGALVKGVAHLMKKNRVEVATGHGRLLAPGRVRVEGEGGAREIACRHVILATGSAPAELPGLPFDGERVVSSTEALAFPEVPRRLVVVGAGAVGLELASVWSRLGSEVTVVELLPEIAAGADRGAAKLLRRALARQGIRFLLGARVAGAALEGDAVAVRVREAGGGERTLQAERVLVAVGRRPYTDGLGLEAAGVATDERGRVVVDGRLATSAPGVHAIGDVVPGPMLAHKAEEEGVAVAERLAGLPGHVSYETIPAVIYTAPELAWVGATEEALAERGVAYRAGQFPFAANGRARTLGETDGMVKLLACARTDRLLGAHVVGPRASDLVPELVLALELQLAAEDVARTVHAHPTLAEAVKEAALAVDGRAIHV